MTKNFHSPIIHAEPYIELVTVLVGTCEADFRIGPCTLSDDPPVALEGVKWNLMPGFDLEDVVDHILQFDKLHCFLNPSNRSTEPVTFPHFVQRQDVDLKNGHIFPIFDVYCTLHRVIRPGNYSGHALFWTEEDAINYLHHSLEHEKCVR